MINLPTEAKPRPAPSLAGDTLLCFGAPKSGKTKLVTSWPNCLVIDTEGGARKYGGITFDVRAKAREVDVPPLEVLRQVAGELLKDCPYDAVAIDTLDEVSRWIEVEAVARMNKKHGTNPKDPKKPPYTDIADIKYGAGYGEHRNLVMSVVETFKSLPCTTILVAHSKHATTDDGETMTKTIDLPGKLAHWVAAACDHIGMTSVTKDRKFQIDFGGYEIVTGTGIHIQQAGSRLAELNGAVVANDKESIERQIGCTTTGEAG